MTIAQFDAGILTNKKIAWLYPGYDHTTNPILIQAIQTLARFGAELTLYDLTFPKSKVSQSQYRHVPISRVSLPLKSSSAIRLPKTISRFGMLAQVVAWRPHLIIASNPDVALVGWVAKSLTRAPLIYYPYELFGEEFLHQDSVFTRLMLTAERFLLKYGVDALITQNPERAKVYSAERWAKVTPTVVYNFKTRNKVSSHGQLKQAVGLESNRRIVLYEGAIQPGRCLENLIKAAKHFPQDAHLVLIGNQGEYFKRVLFPLAQESKIQNIHFLPWMPQSKLRSLIADADVGIIIYEDKPRNNLFCAPGKLSDYVHAGIPVAASDLPTLRPIIEQYKIGTCFDSHSPLSIAKAVEQVLQMPASELRPAIEYASQELSWETQEPFLLRLTGEMLNASTEDRQ